MVVVVVGRWVVDREYVTLFGRAGECQAAVGEWGEYGENEDLDFAKHRVSIA